MAAGSPDPALMPLLVRGSWRWEENGEEESKEDPAKTGGQEDGDGNPKPTSPLASRPGC